MEPISIKAVGTAIGGIIAMLIAQMFSVPPEAFIAALIGSIIGEFAAGKSTFCQTVFTVISVTILTAWGGKFLLDAYPSMSPTSVLGCGAFFCSYYRVTILKRGNDVIGYGAKAIGSYFDKVAGK